MTQAKITRKEGYRIAPNGAIVEVIPCGHVVTGKIAEAALQDGAASRMFDPREETKVTGPAEIKKRGRPKKKAE